MFEIVSGMYLIAASFLRLFCLILLATSENEYIIDWDTTKTMNANEVTIHFCWLG